MKRPSNIIIIYKTSFFAYFGRGRGAGAGFAEHELLKIKKTKPVKQILLFMYTS